MTMGVVVIGGGVVGTACAWRIAQRGRSVRLVDPAPGSGATAVAAGMLAPVSELLHGEEALLRLGLAAAHDYPRYVRDVERAAGAEVGYRACGTLAVALTADDRARLAEIHSVQGRLGLEVEALSGRASRELEPLLDPGVSAGVLIRGDHQVDPRRLIRALRAAAERAGVEFVTARGRPEWTRGTRAGVRLDDGRLLAADRVVLATGARAGPETAPVRPVKGQILRLRMPAGGAVLSRTVRGSVHGAEVYLVPRLDGELVVGATTEERGFDQRITVEAVHRLLRDAQALVPAVGELEFVAAGARSRPGTPDNLPLVGESGPDGLILATGHYRNGVLLSGITADAVAGLVAGEPLSGPLLACDPARFTGPAGPPATTPATTPVRPLAGTERR